ncbi:MAG: hypothetical protein K6C34_00510 [Alphaproteobacteria bacterium]|nr:hypothetical protein [Alphaproteobacteria bacterium]
MDEKRNFYTITEVLQILDNTISRTQLHKYIQNGKIKTVAFGSKKLIYADWVNDLLAGKVRL